MRNVKLIALITILSIFSLAMMLPVASAAQKKKRTSKSTAAKSTAKKSTGGSSALGAKVFDAQCSTCHDKGENTVEADKTLKLDALKKNGFNGVDDIKKRVEEGKGVMPSFKADLKPAEIDAVANYVWTKAQKGW